MNRFFCFVVFIFSTPFALGQVFKPAVIFGSNMVLQQEMNVPVFGVGKAGATVTVTFAEQTVSTKIGENGKWKAELKPMKASSENRDLTIKSGDREMVFENVLVGEVWLGSGQSNMAGRVASYMKKDQTLAEIANKDIPELRLFGNTSWSAASPATSRNHSALLFAFGERLHRELGVPVGLFVGAVGGTPSGAWIPEETFNSSERIKSVVDDFAKHYDPDRAMKQYEAKLARWEELAKKAEAEGTKMRGRKPTPPVGPGKPTRRPIGSLFDRYIRPHVGFAIRGVLWDQGEAGTAVVGLDQHTCMSELIRGWRELWGQGEFPFLFVQKPSGNGNAFSTDNPITREGEPFAALPDIKDATRRGGGDTRFLYTRLMLDNPDAWMVPASDLGTTIHPINKWGYGNRAAEVAAQKVYKKEGIQAYGPIYESHSVSGNQVTVKFREAGKGLTVKHSDKLQGFALAGEDGVWHWADARIQGADTVVLSSENVAEPKQVRFAYANHRQWANLFNRDGLPALAFTTEKK